MKPINILFPFEFNISEGGAQQSIFQIIKYLDKENFHIHVLLPKESVRDHIPPFSSVIKKIKKIHVETKFGSYGVWEFKKKKPFTTILHGFLFILFIHRYIKKNDIDIIHTNMYGSLFWCCIYKHFYKNFRLIHHYRGFNNAGDSIIKFFQKKIDILVCTSDSMYEKWKKSLISPLKVHCIYNTVEVPCQLPPCKKEKVIINVARISEIKNQILFLKTADYLVHEKGIQCRFLLIGDVGLFHEDDSYYQVLLSFINEKELSPYIQFLGHQAQTELIDIYKKSFVCVGCCPVESFGRVFIESMAWGTPVIAVNGGGIKSIIDHGIEGLLYGAEDFQEAGDLVIDLLNNDDQYQSIRNQAFEKVQRCFNSANKTENYAKLYQHVVGEVDRS